VSANFVLPGVSSFIIKIFFKVNILLTFVFYFIKKGGPVRSLQICLAAALVEKCAALTKGKGYYHVQHLMDDIQRDCKSIRDEGRSLLPRDMYFTFSLMSCKLAPAILEESKDSKQSMLQGAVLAGIVNTALSTAHLSLRVLTLAKDVIFLGNHRDNEGVDANDGAEV
jgi:formiminotetrahydrofolate cyclodeaminase